MSGHAEADHVRDHGRRTTNVVLGSAPAAKRLSVPRRATTPPVAPSAAQLATLAMIADVLIPGSGDDPRGSQAPDYEHWLTVSLAARADALDLLYPELDRLAAFRTDELGHELRRLHKAQPETFHVISSVTAGAYLQAPRIRELIGYPGQVRAAAGVTEAVDDLDGGLLLEAVIARGSIYVSAEGE